MEKENHYQVELVWNRDFNFVPYGNPHTDLDKAIELAHVVENSGDGARVKKTRVVDAEGKICWQYGRKIGK